MEAALVESAAAVEAAASAERLVAAAFETSAEAPEQPVSVVLELQLAPQSLAQEEGL